MLEGTIVSHSISGDSVNPPQLENRLQCNPNSCKRPLKMPGATSFPGLFPFELGRREKGKSPGNEVVPGEMVAKGGWSLTRAGRTSTILAKSLGTLSQEHRRFPHSPSTPSAVLI